jgi:hypothetical protein
MLIVVISVSSDRQHQFRHSEVGWNIYVKPWSFETRCCCVCHFARADSAGLKRDFEVDCLCFRYCHHAMATCEKIATLPTWSIFINVVSSLIFRRYVVQAVLVRRYPHSKLDKDPNLCWYRYEPCHPLCACRVYAFFCQWCVLSVRWLAFTELCLGGWSRHCIYAY